MAFATGYTSRAGRSRGANMNSGTGKAGRPGKAFRLSGGPKSPRPGKGFLGPQAAKPGAPSKPKPKPVGRSAQPDSTYNTQVDLATRRGESRLNELQGQEDRLKYDFGIGDPTNPFSRIEGMKRIFLAKYRGRSAGLAAQGHLYSGAHERALSRTRLEEEEARAGLRAAFDQAMGQIESGRSNVKFTTEEEKNQAFEDWLARVGDSEGTVDQGGGSTAPTPAPTPTTTKASAPVKSVSAPPPIAGAGANAPVTNSNRKLPAPVPQSQVGKPKSSVEQRLRAQLRKARANDNKKRVKVIKKKLAKVNRAKGYRRG